MKSIVRVTSTHDSNGPFKVRRVKIYPPLYRDDRGEERESPVDYMSSTPN